MQTSALPATLFAVAFRSEKQASSAREGELFDLVVAYARQETIEPLRGVGKWIVRGLVSMFLVSLGVVLVSLGLLRAVQDLSGSTFDGAWSFVPYVFGVMFSVVIVAVAITQIRKPNL